MNPTVLDAEEADQGRSKKRVAFHPQRGFYSFLAVQAPKVLCYHSLA
jgi:hypothetical protein